MNRKIFVRRLICVLLVASAVICSATACSIFPDEENVAIPVLKTPKPVEYAKYVVKKGNIERGSSGIGTVMSVYYTKASFKTSGGHISKFNVSLEDTVEEGDILVELDNSTLALQLEEAEINRDLQQLRYDEALEKYGDAQNVYVRQAALELKKVTNTYNTVKAAYEDTLLRAPVSGVVVYMNTKYSTGNSAVTAGETIIAIDSLDKKYTYLTFSKSIEALNNPSLDPPEEFRIGSELALQRLSTEDVEEPWFTGTVVSDSSVIEETEIGYVSSATYYCKMNNPPENIKNGDTVVYKYVEATAEDVLVIPISSYYTYEGKTFVYVLDKNNLKVEKYIEIGLEDSTNAEVVSGLEAGDVVVLA